MVYDSSLRVHYNDYFQVYLLWYICYHQSVMSGVDRHVMLFSKAVSLPSLIRNSFY